MVSILGNISRLKVECLLRGLLIGRGHEVKGVNEKDEDVIKIIIRKRGYYGMLQSLLIEDGQVG